MNTVPIPAFPKDVEGFEHPTWCDLGECTAPSALRQRGRVEADVPLYLQDNHLSTPWIITTDRTGEVEFTLQAWRGTPEIVSDTVDGVALVADFTVQNLRVGMPVTVAQLAPLAQAFTGLRDTAIRTHTDNPIVDEVAHALRVLGAVTRSNADALLSLTTVQLTDRERTAVLFAFPTEMRPGSGNHMGERPPTPGELCECGQPATRVMYTEHHGEIPLCTQHAAGAR